jgi:hypothetical protein
MMEPDHVNQTPSCNFARPANFCDVGVGLRWRDNFRQAVLAE